MDILGTRPISKVLPKYDNNQYYSKFAIHRRVPTSFRSLDRPLWATSELSRAGEAADGKDKTGPDLLFDSGKRNSPAEEANFSRCHVENRALDMACLLRRLFFPASNQLANKSETKTRPSLTLPPATLELPGLSNSQLSACHHIQTQPSW